MAVLLFCLLSLVAPAWAQETPATPAVQVFADTLDEGEAHYYRLASLKQGQILYATMENRSGNLDPLLTLVDGASDVKLLRQQLDADVQTAVAAGVGPLAALAQVAPHYLLAWNDDAASSHRAQLTFPVPADGDYLLIARGSLNQPTFGDYRLTVGVDAPQVLSGGAKPIGQPFAQLDANLSLSHSGVQQISGQLTPEKPSTFFVLKPFAVGDTLTVSVEATEGDLRPVATLTDFSGKPLRYANFAGKATTGTLQYRFTSPATDYVLYVDACCGDQPAPGSFRLTVGRNAPEVLTGQATSGGEAVVNLPTPVHIGIKLQQITDVDQKAENYGAQATLRMEWQDPALAFNPDTCQCSFKTYNLDTFKDFAALAGQHWPAFTLYNQQDNRWTQNKRVNVTPDGKAVYLERFTTTFQAPDFNFRRFPFDQQEFYLRVDNMLSEEYFVFENDPTFTEVGSQLGEEEWYIVSSDTSVTSESASTKFGTSRYSFHFSAKRHLQYYAVRFFVPIALIVLVSWVTFFLKDFTKRIEAASANLLLFIAYSFSIANDLPRLGYLTFMDAVLLGTFAINVFVVVYNVVMRRMEINGQRARADRLDRYMIWIYPTSYLVSAGVVTWMFLG